MSLENEIAELRREISALRVEIANVRGTAFPVPMPYYPAHPQPYPYPVTTQPWWGNPAITHHGTPTCWQG
jgi:hypothetical protein